jgi:hypothetical protein
MTGNDTWGSAPFIPGVNRPWGQREFIWIASGTALRPNTTTCQQGSCPVSASGCYMYTRLNTYTANVSNGILNEKLVNSVPMPGVDCFTAVRKDCLTPTDWTFLSNPNISLTSSSYPNSDYIPFCNFTEYTANITAACIYDLGPSSQFSLQYFFTDTGGFNTGLFLSGNLYGEGPAEAVGPNDLLVRPCFYTKLLNFQLPTQQTPELSLSDKNFNSTILTPYAVPI